MLFSFRRGALLAGFPTVLALLSLSAAVQTPARSAFEILEVGRWSNPPKKVNPLAAHHTYHSAAMNCDVGYTIYLPPNYAAASVRFPVVYWLPGGGYNHAGSIPSTRSNFKTSIKLRSTSKLGQKVPSFDFPMRWKSSG
jgi:hypothetical protein